MKQRKKVLIPIASAIILIGIIIIVAITRKPEDYKPLINAPDKPFELNSFESNDDLTGWYGRSDEPIKFEISDFISYTGENSVMISERIEDWNGIGKEFPVEVGKTYEVSTWVYQNSGSDQTIILSAAVTMDGIDGYQNVYRSTCPSGEWTKLYGTFTAGQNSEKTVFYLETLNAPNLVFFVDDFSVEVGGTSSLPTDIPSLKQEYQDKFMIGAAVPRASFADDNLMELLKQQYATFTPENELKPENVLDIKASQALAENGDETHPVTNFEQAKPLLEFAKNNDIKVHGHVLVWYSQTPDEFFKSGYKTDGELVSREIMLQRMENYIASIMDYVNTNYPDVITSWDVVNEAIADDTAQLRPTKADNPEKGCMWMDTVGDDYVLKAFEYARKYAPSDVKLFYNDYSVPFEPKLTAIKNLVEPIYEKGLIDGIGFQSHYEIFSPSAKQLSESLSIFADMGLRIRISELDIGIDNNSEELLLKQAYRFSDLFKVFDNFSDNIDAVVFWGVSDATSWKSANSPLLFDVNMQPKLAFWALTDSSKLPSPTLIANSYGPCDNTDENFDMATKYTFSNHTLQSIYNDNNIYVKVSVNDNTPGDTDKVIVYLDDKSYEVNRSDCESNNDGYTAMIEIPETVRILQSIKFDTMIIDNGNTCGWNDNNATDENRKFGKLSIRQMASLAESTYGKPDMTLDTIDTAQWDKATYYDISATEILNADEGHKVNAKFKTLWQEDMLYILFDITDPHLDDSAANSYEQDSVEVFIDEGNDKKSSYESGDGQYRLNFKNVLNIDHGDVKPEHRTIITDNGFMAEIAIPLTQSEQAGDILGFDVRYNNATASGSRTILNFYDTSDTGWKDTMMFGLLKLN